MKQTRNKKGFSLILGLLLVLVMIGLVIFILELMIPYSKNTKGIENASNALYQAQSGVESALYDFKLRGSNFTDTSDSFSSAPIDFSYTTTSNGSLTPPTGEGQSPYDLNRNYDILAPGEPIQIEIGNNAINWATARFYFKVPNMDGAATLDETLQGTNPIIFWQVSSTTDTLNGVNLISAGTSEICTGNSACSGFLFNGKQGQNLGGNGTTTNERLNNNATAFYKTQCGTGKKCSLKLSIINPLTIQGGVSIPYLEYKINFGASSLPLRYSEIQAGGKSYGFQKLLDVKVPQQTTNQAFDFTIFQ